MPVFLLGTSRGTMASSWAMTINFDKDCSYDLPEIKCGPARHDPNIKGATLLHNRYLVDGLDITDPVTNTFSANINFDSIASVEVLTGGMEAQYNSLGGIINLISVGGGNDWHFDSSFYINNQALRRPELGLVEDVAQADRIQFRRARGKQARDDRLADGCEIDA